MLFEFGSSVVLLAGRLFEPVLVSDNVLLSALTSDSAISLSDVTLPDGLPLSVVFVKVADVVLFLLIIVVADVLAVASTVK